MKSDEMKSTEQVALTALRVIALSYKYRIDKQDTPPHEYARTVLEELGISLDSIPED